MVTNSDVITSRAIFDNLLPSDIDIQVDWLYKGKRKIKHPVTTSNTPVNTKTSVASVTSDLKPTDAEFKYSNDLVTNEDILDNTNRNASRNRSSSISNAVLSSGILAKSRSTADKSVDKSIENSKKQIKRSHSVSNATVASQVAQNKIQNTSTTTKKSLFGSLFGKKAASSSLSPPASAPASVPAIDTSVKQVAAVQHLSSSPNKIADDGALSPVRTITNSSSASSNSFGLTHANIASTNTHPIQPSDLHELKTISLKRVSFAVDSFENDPPQQLPSRKPRQGNVLIPGDMISNIPSISVGISNTVATPNTTGSASSATKPIFTKDSKEYKIAAENYKMALKESDKHQQEAHYAAQRIANEVANFKAKALSASLTASTTAPVSTAAKANATETTMEYEKESFHSSKIHSIDTPIQQHDYFYDSDCDNEENNNQNGNKELTLDSVYTRCCHLREILPIPSTLRQVKGKTAPLQILKFLNPKPTLIDILSFCDFISIVPINTIIFDNVTLNAAMFKILLTSLVNSTAIEKIGLRNVLIDSGSWKLLCKFLLQNKSISKLDISQTKVKSDLPSNLYRHVMDWQLFSQVLLNRMSKENMNGDNKVSYIEELLLNGIKFSNIPLEEFQNVLTSFSNAAKDEMRTSNALPVSLRLGLASSDIGIDQLKVVLNWMSQYHIQGVDMSFNDLSSLVKPAVSKLSSSEFDDLEYFTLNSTNISTGYDVALILKYLSKLPKLKFLDLSNLPQVFPDVLPFMHKYLPKFPELRRIHFDNNNLRYKDISMVCTILVKCPKISHISIMTQSTPTNSTVTPSSTTIARTPSNSGSTPPLIEPLSPTLGSTSVVQPHSPKTSQEGPKTNFLAYYGSLYNLVKDSPHLVTLDINYNDIPDEIRSRIAVCLVRNMDRTIDSSFQLDDLTSQDDLVFDGTIITETAENVIESLHTTPLEHQQHDSTKRYLLKKYIEKLQNVYNTVQQTIDNLFEKQNTDQLSLQEKENLLRLLLVEKNLSHILEIFSNIPQFGNILGTSTTPLPPLKHFDSNRDTNNVMITTNTTTSSAAPARPHLMATDSGRVIDVFTGKPLLMRSSSSTSEFGKKQEEEEGELHKWGFFVQQQRSLYPDHEQPSTIADRNVKTSVIRDIPHPAANNVSTNSRSNSSAAPNIGTSGGSYPKSSTSPYNPDITTNPYPQPTPQRVFAKIPSGDEVRHAVIKARGIHSIEDLIDKVSKNTSDLDTIYGTKLVFDDQNSTSDSQQQTSRQSKSISLDTSPTANTITSAAIGASNSTASPNKTSSNQVKCKEVQEKYDEVLNKLSNVRLNKV